MEVEGEENATSEMMEETEESRERKSQTDDSGERNAETDDSREKNDGTEGSRERNAEAVDSRERKVNRDAPPDDDCCPICFGAYTIPCRANCGHWYCGSCILQYWNYSAASRPCKCPMCSGYIKNLTPEASLQLQQHPGEEIKEVIADVQRYNRLFVGGLSGLLQKARDLPFILRRVVREMMDPDARHDYLNEVRLIALCLSLLYAATPLDFLPGGRRSFATFLDHMAVALVLVLRIVGHLHRRRLARQVRQLAIAHPLHE